MVGLAGVDVGQREVAAGVRQGDLGVGTGVAPHDPDHGVVCRTVAVGLEDAPGDVDGRWRGRFVQRNGDLAVGRDVHRQLDGLVDEATVRWRGHVYLCPPNDLDARVARRYLEQTGRARVAVRRPEGVAVGGVPVAHVHRCSLHGVVGLVDDADVQVVSGRQRHVPEVAGAGPDGDRADGQQVGRVVVDPRDEPPVGVALEVAEVVGRVRRHRCVEVPVGVGDDDLADAVAGDPHAVPDRARVIGQHHPSREGDVVGLVQLHLDVRVVGDGHALRVGLLHEPRAPGRRFDLNLGRPVGLHPDVTRAPVAEPPLGVGLRRCGAEPGSGSLVDVEDVHQRVLDGHAGLVHHGHREVVARRERHRAERAVRRADRDLPQRPEVRPAVVEGGLLDAGGEVALVVAERVGRVRGHRDRERPVPVRVDVETEARAAHGDEVVGRRGTVGALDGSGDSDGLRVERDVLVCGVRTPDLQDAAGPAPLEERLPRVVAGGEAVRVHHGRELVGPRVVGHRELVARAAVVEVALRERQRHVAPTGRDVAGQRQPHVAAGAVLGEHARVADDGRVDGRVVYRGSAAVQQRHREVRRPRGGRDRAAHDVGLELGPLEGQQELRHVRDGPVGVVDPEPERVVRAEHRGAVRGEGHRLAGVLVGQPEAVVGAVVEREVPVRPDADYLRGIQPVARREAVLLGDVDARGVRLVQLDGNAVRSRHVQGPRIALLDEPRAVGRRVDLDDGSTHHLRARPVAPGELQQSVPVHLGSGPEGVVVGEVPVGDREHARVRHGVAALVHDRDVQLVGRRQRDVPEAPVRGPDGDRPDRVEVRRPVVDGRHGAVHAVALVVAEVVGRVRRDAEVEVAVRVRGDVPVPVRSDHDEAVVHRAGAVREHHPARDGDVPSPVERDVLVGRARAPHLEDLGPAPVVERLPRVVARAEVARVDDRRELVRRCVVSHLELEARAAVVEVALREHQRDVGVLRNDVPGQREPDVAGRAVLSEHARVADNRGLGSSGIYRRPVGGVQQRHREVRQPRGSRDGAVHGVRG